MNDTKQDIRSRLTGPTFAESANSDPVAMRYPPAQDNGQRNRKTDSAFGMHYDRVYKGIKLDPYRIFKVYGITDPAQQHLIKKGLRAGQSVKDLKQDIREIISTAQRWLEMLEEDAA